MMSFFSSFHPSLLWNTGEEYNEKEKELWKMLEAERVTNEKHAHHASRRHVQHAGSLL